MNKEFIDALKSLSLFKDLSDAERKNIADQIEIEQFPANSVIVREGDYGDKVYFIMEGTAEVYILDKEGKEHTITTLSEGNYFGELAVLVDGFRNNSVKAKTLCKLLSLTKDKFNTLISSNLLVSVALNKALSQRLGETLHLMSAKKANIVILMILSDQAEARVKHFEEYLRTLVLNPVVCIDGNISEDAFARKCNEIDNHYYLIKSNVKPADYFRQHANFIVNFLEKDTSHYCLTDQATPWQIENAVRKITRKTVGIALCSGGAPGIAQLGVLKVLQAENIPVDYIVGTSIGSVIGCCHAFSFPVEHILSKFLEMNQKSVLMSLATLLRNISLNLSGFLENSFYRKFFNSVFGDRSFSDDHIPFAAIASDLISGQTVVLNKGKIVDAIVASNTAPVLFEPYRQDHQLLIDGVATDPLPVDVLNKEGIDIKIAVPIPQLDLAVSITKKSKLIAIYVRSRSMMAECIVRNSAELADVIISPHVEGINMNDWRNVEKIIEAGEKSAKIAIKRIQYLLYGTKHHK
ncbi:MAG: patatin-like phospholipase family protein [Gammaproteobacteria bacterium]